MLVAYKARHWLIKLFFIFFLSFFAVFKVNASCANVPMGGDYTISDNCSFADTANHITGLDKGTGTQNTARLKVTNNAWLTLLSNQVLVTGTIIVDPGSRVVIPQGAKIEIGVPLWVIDADGDGYPSSKEVTASRTKPSGGVRRNTISSLDSVDCNDNSGSIHPGTVCRAAAGPCDVAEYCQADGSCPADSFKSSSTVCRASAGACDVAEYCTGSSASCPADAFRPATYNPGGTCQKCTGTSATPVNQTSSEDKWNQCSTGASGSSTSCRSNYCSGTSAACGHLASGTTCRASAGACDVAETCTGSADSCPADSFKSSSTVCRASAGACDVAEYCTGSSASCPADAFRPATYNPGGTCQKCTGTSATPVNQTSSEDKWNQCSASWTGCSNACTKTGSDGYCDGSGACKTGGASAPVADGKVCSGGSEVSPSTSHYCGTATSCTNGSCVGTTYYRACDGSGACRSDNTYAASANNIYAATGYTLTSSCATNGTSLCGYSGYNGCNGSCQRKRDQYRCSSSHTCSYDVGDSYANCGSNTICSSGSCSSSGYCSSGSIYCHSDRYRYQDRYRCNGSNSCSYKSYTDNLQDCGAASYDCSNICTRRYNYKCSGGSCGTYSSIAGYAGSGQICSGGSIVSGQCGTDTYLDEYRCSGNTIQRKYRNYECNGSGTCAYTDSWVNQTTCGGGENSRCVAGKSTCQNLCSNGSDDDGDGWTDGTDSDCGGCQQCTSGTCCNTSTACYKSSSTVCRASAGTCDPAEYCTGSSTACPADVDHRPAHTAYRDSDGDGYGNPHSTTTYCDNQSVPSGWVTNNSDCYDSNANARPGQCSYFATNRGDGSFDYDCVNHPYCQSNCPSHCGHSGFGDMDYEYPRVWLGGCWTDHSDNCDNMAGNRMTYTGWKSTNNTWPACGTTHEYCQKVDCEASCFTNCATYTVKCK